MIESYIAKQMPNVKEKCPHYDPNTRQQVRPGKSCPDYNSLNLSGCPYAHPWETTWDDNKGPFIILPTARNVEGGASDSHRDEPHPSTQNAMLVDVVPQVVNQDAMEVDTEEGNQDPASISTVDTGETKDLVEMSFESVDPAETDALFEFIKHLMISLHQAHAYDVESISLQNYKAQYKATVDDNGHRPIRDISTPATHSAWVEGKEVRDAKVKERRELMEGWINGLVHLDGEERPRMTEDGDRIMVDAGDATAEGEIEESPLVQALRRRKRRLQRGFVGQQMVELLVKMEDTEHLLEETRNRQMADLEGPQQQLRITSSTTDPLQDGDSEMSENIPTGPTGRQPTDLTPTFQRINDRLDRIKMAVSDADVWVTDSYTEDLQRAVGKKLEKYLENLETPKKDPLEQLLTSRASVNDEQISAEVLIRLLGNAPIFDASTERDTSSLEQESAEIQATQQTLDALLNNIEGRQNGLTSLKQDERVKLVKTTGSSLIKQLYTDPTLSDGLWKQAQTFAEPTAVPIGKHMLHPSDSIGYSLPPLDVSEGVTAQKARQQAWLAEYDEVKKQAMELVRPVVQRTKKQMENLERSERERVEGLRSNEQMMD